MTIACAVGMRRAMARRPGGTWGPRLIAIYGAGLMAAGLLRADPAYGFGPGAPAGKAVHISWHAAGHLISASIGFTALIVACFVVARYFSRERRRGLAIYSRASGLAFLAAFAGVTTGSDAGAIVLAFYAGVLIAWIWIAVTSVHLYRRAGARARSGRPLTSTRVYSGNTTRTGERNALHDAAVRHQPGHPAAARAVRGDHEARRGGYPGARDARHRRAAAQARQAPGSA